MGGRWRQRGKRRQMKVSVRNLPEIVSEGGTAAETERAVKEGDKLEPA